MHMDWTFSGAAPWNISNYAPYPKPEDPDKAGPATQFGGDPAYEQIMFRCVLTLGWARFARLVGWVDG